MRDNYRGRGRIRWWQALLALVLAGALVFAGLLGAVLYGAYDHIQGEIRAVVVLGCRVMPGGEPSQLLQDRLEEALTYLEEEPEVLVVVSGGQGSNEPTTEARCMADYLVSSGVEEERILLEERSHNTRENLLYSRAVLEEAGVDPKEDGVLLVSNGFHLTRARMLAQRLDYGAVSTLAAPSSHLPSRLQMYVREPLALVKSFIFDR